MVRFSLLLNDFQRNQIERDVFMGVLIGKEDSNFTKRIYFNFTFIVDKVFDLQTFKLENTKVNVANQILKNVNYYDFIHYCFSFLTLNPELNPKEVYTNLINYFSFICEDYKVFNVLSGIENDETEWINPLSIHLFFEEILENCFDFKNFDLSKTKKNIAKFILESEEDDIQEAFDAVVEIEMSKIPAEIETKSGIKYTLNEEDVVYQFQEKCQKYLKILNKK